MFSNLRLRKSPALSLLPPSLPPDWCPVPLVSATLCILVYVVPTVVAVAGNTSHLHINHKHSISEMCLYGVLAEVEFS